MHTTISTRLPRLAAAAAIAALALTGCAAGDTGTAPTHAATGTTPAAAESHQHYFVTEAWVEASDGGTSAVYGVIESRGHHEVTLLSASTSVAGAAELHEASGTATQERAEGFAIAEGERLLLEPGGSRIVLLDLSAPLVAGEEIEITPVFSDDEEVTFSAPVKAGASVN